MSQFNHFTMCGATALLFLLSQTAVQAQTATAENPAITAKKAADFVGDSSLNLNLRNYAEDLQLVGANNRHAWVQGARLVFQSGFTPGEIGLGLDATLFGALKLDGGRGTRNMVHVGKNGTGQNDKGWATMGEYAVKAKAGDAMLKYGLQTISNPFLDPYDIRALPPTFMGWSLAAGPYSGVALSAGTVTATKTRGADFLQKLSSSYGGVEFDRLSYLGADVNVPNDGTASLYASRAENVWDQYFGALSQSFGQAKQIKWTGNVNGYYSRAQGKKLQGNIDGKAYSLSLTAQHEASSLILAWQHNASDQFFDFTQETAGIFLANAMAVDYNAPHERSIQVRYEFNGKDAGLPGFKISLWTVRGHGVDGSVEAARYSAADSLLHDLYWRNGRPINGGHHEYGVKPTYVVQSGMFKGSRLSLLMVVRRISPDYPSRSFADARFMWDMPIKVF